MYIWSSLNWTILSQDELVDFMRPASSIVDSPEVTVNRLITRNLLVIDRGPSPISALNDLLDKLFTVPVSHGIIMKTLIFFVLLRDTGSFHTARKVFGIQEYLLPDEKIVYGWARKNRATASYLIKIVQ